MLHIILLNLVFYFNTLKLGLVSDDIPTFENPMPYKNKFHKMFLEIFCGAKYSIQRGHLITLIVHTMTCCMIHLAFGMNDISLIAALLFSVNPVTNQGSIFISGRGYALPALFLLSALSLPVLSPIFMCASAYYHPAYLCLIAVLGHANWWIIVFAPICWLICFPQFRKVVRSKQEGERVTEDKRIHFGKVIVFIKTLGFYFTLCLIPFKLTFYHSYMQSMAGNEIMRKRAYSIDKYFMIGLFLLTFTLYSTIFNHSIVSYGLWWFIVCIAPYCNFLRLNQEIAERYCYMPAIGVMLALSGLISSPMILTAMFTFYAVRMWYYYNRAYVDDYWLIEMSTTESPEAWYAWHMRGHKRINQTALKEALNMWTMARLISPKEFKILFNLAVLLLMIKNKNEAMKFFDLAEKFMVEGQEKQALKWLNEARTGKVFFLT